MLFFFTRGRHWRHSVLAVTSLCTVLAVDIVTSLCTLLAVLRVVLGLDERLVLGLDVGYQLKTWVNQSRVNVTI